MIGGNELSFSEKEPSKDELTILDFFPYYVKEPMLDDLGETLLLPERWSGILYIINLLKNLKIIKKTKNTKFSKNSIFNNKKTKRKK